jgi:putative ABC transport system permease protein
MPPLPRKILVVLQFFVSATLIIGTIIVFRQVQFAKNRPVGYERTGVLQMSMKTTDIHNNFTAVRNDLLSSGAILEIAESGSPLTDVYSNSSGFDWEGKAPDLQDDFAFIRITPEFGKVAQWQLIDGRDFSRDIKADSSALILNEASVKFMNLKHPVGATVKSGDYKYHVIGVIKDMIMSSPYEPVKTTLFSMSGGGGDLVDIRLNPKMSTHNALAKIEATFKQYDPASPFDYKFNR